MIDLTLIGIGTGSMGHLTREAVAAMANADLILIPTKGSDKADLAEPETLTRLRVAGPDVIAVSARTGEGIEELRELVASLLPRPAVEVDLVVPYTRGDLISQAHTSGDVLAEEHLEGGTRLHALVDSQLAAALHAAVAG